MVFKFKKLEEFDKYFAKKLEEEEVVCLPTDTIYGLACDAFSKKARNKLIEIKGRDYNKPISVVFGSFEEALKYVECDENIFRVAQRFLPGPLTMVLKAKKNFPSYAVSKQGTIGIRVCDDERLNEFLLKYKKPLLLTSANKAGGEPINDIDMLCKVFLHTVSCGVVSKNDESLTDYVPSTVVSFVDNKVEVVREGAIKKEDILKVYNRIEIINKVYIGSDHGGFECKKVLISNLQKQGFEVFDQGTFSTESCDYPDFALKVCENVVKDEKSRGILICTTGEGMFITANKVNNIRCGMGYNKYVSEKTVQHNNANVIAFGAKPYFDFEIKSDTLTRNYEFICQCASYFLNADFEGGRHQKRVDKICKLEK